MKNEQQLPRFRVVPLREAADIVMGNSPPGDSYNEDGRGIPLINGPVEFSEDALGLTRRTKYTTQPTKMCVEGDLLLCVRGSTTGRTNVAGFDACIGRGVVAIRAKEHQPYLNQFMCTQRTRLFAAGNGSTFPSITADQLAEVKVPMPPLPVQKRIAAILDKADGVRRKRREAERLAVQLRTAAFHEMFGNGKAARDGWSLRQLGTVAEVQGGIALSSSHRDDLPLQVPYLRVANVFRDRLDLNEIKQVGVTEDELRKSRLTHGDVLIVEGHGNREELGRSAVWDGSIDGCVHQNHLIRVRPFQNHLHPIYLSAFLNSASGRQQLLRMGKTTSGLNTISISNVRGIRIMLPPLPLQRQYASYVQGTIALTDRMRKSAQEAGELFDSLVQWAFRGEL